MDLIVGKPLKTSDERAEEIGPAAGIPIFGLDALSSAAYGPEAALTLLIPLGLLVCADELFGLEIAAAERYRKDAEVFVGPAFRYYFAPAIGDAPPRFACSGQQ